MHSTKAVIPQGYIVLLFTSNFFCLINSALSSNSHISIILNLCINQEKATLVQHEGRIDNNDFFNKT